jgi:hypothetical protein
MIHKIWDKDAGSDEEGSIRDNLVKSYQMIYFSPEEDSVRQPAEIITFNLIK